MKKVVAAQLLSLALLLPLGHAAIAAETQTKSKLMEACFSPAEQCDVRIIQFIGGARKSLDIAIYAITHPEIVAAIKDAHKNGVMVRMVVDRTQASGNSSLVDDLKAAGIPLKMGDNRGRGIMHHKFTIVDGQALETGSYNYTKNATMVNSENQIYLHDSKIIEVFQKDFELIWNNGLTPPAAEAP